MVLRKSCCNWGLKQELSQLIVKECGYHRRQCVESLWLPWGWIPCGPPPRGGCCSSSSLGTRYWWLWLGGETNKCLFKEIRERRQVHRKLKHRQAQGGWRGKEKETERKNKREEERQHMLWRSFIYFLNVLIIFLSFFFVLLGPHPQHMEVPSSGGLIRAVAACLQHSHSNTRSEPHLQPTSQLTAMPDP